MQYSHQNPGRLWASLYPHPPGLSHSHPHSLTAPPFQPGQTASPPMLKVPVTKLNTQGPIQGCCLSHACVYVVSVSPRSSRGELPLLFISRDALLPAQNVCFANVISMRCRLRALAPGALRNINPHPSWPSLGDLWCLISSPADFYLLRLKHHNLFGLSSPRTHLAR